MITSFGKLAKKKRVDLDMSARSMSESLMVSPAYVSAIESGNRDVTPRYLEKVKAFFRLDDEEFKQFEAAAKASNSKLKMSLTGLSQDHRLLACRFADRLPTLTDEGIRAINEAMINDTENN